MNGAALGESVSRVRRSWEWWWSSIVSELSLQACVCAVGDEQIGLERAVIRWQRRQLLKTSSCPALCQVVRSRLLTSRPESCSSSASTSKTPTNKPRKRGQRRRKRRGGQRQQQQEGGEEEEEEGAEERPSAVKSEQKQDRRRDHASNKAKSPARSNTLVSPSLATKEGLETAGTLDYESWDELRDSYIDLDLADIDERAARSGQAFEDAYLDDYAVYLNSLPTKSSQSFVWRYLFNHVPEVVVCALSTFGGYAVGRYVDIQVEWSRRDKEAVCTAIGMLVGLTLGKYGVLLARKAISR